ncbi:MAG: hypothetical protein ACYDAG_03815 [Chloroflexota bacterium]
MMVYPLAVAALSVVFAAAVGRQYLARRKPYQLVWTAALLMSASASAAYVLALPPVGSGIAFRAYYLLGGVCMPAWLGLGSIYLVAPRRVADPCFSALLILSLIGAAVVAGAPLDTTALAHLNGGPGTHVLQPGPWLPVTILLNTLGVLAVVGVAVFSGIRLAQRRSGLSLLGANVLIAGGDLIVGLAGSMARLGAPSLFWVTMFAGWLVIFSGFALTMPRSRAQPQSAGTTGATVSRA